MEGLIFLVILGYIVYRLAFIEGKRAGSRKAFRVGFRRGLRRGARKRR